MVYYLVGFIYLFGFIVLVEGGYDVGVRFGVGVIVGNIFFLFFGCFFNVVQFVVMQGVNVFVIQWKGNFFMGGLDGGYIIW